MDFVSRHCQMVQGRHDGRPQEVVVLTLRPQEGQRVKYVVGKARNGRSHPLDEKRTDVQDVHLEIMEKIINQF